MADDRLRKVSFTGSTGVGATLLEQAAPGIINTSMELGGDGPFIVLDDADVELAAQQAVVCKFRNAGQACVAANRIIVHSDVIGQFTERFVELTKTADRRQRLRRRRRRRADHLGAPTRHRGRAGRDAARDGCRTVGRRIRRTTARATSSSRRCSACTTARPNCAAENCSPPSPPCTKSASTAEAIAFANDTKYGLAAYVFTKDLSRAVAVSERLDFGMVGVNRGIMADPAAAFGGVKASGLGREGGHDAIHDYLEPKYLALTVNEEEGLS